VIQPVRLETGGREVRWKRRGQEEEEEEEERVFLAKKDLEDGRG